MRYPLALAAILLATPALAQTPPVLPPNINTAINVWKSISAAQTSLNASLETMQPVLQSALTEAVQDKALAKYWEDYASGLLVQMNGTTPAAPPK